MRVRVAPQHYAAGDAFLGDLNAIDARPHGGEMEGLGGGVVDREAVNDEEEGEGSFGGGGDGDSSSVGCMHESYRSSLTLHGVQIDEEHSAPKNCSRPSSPPFDILRAEDVLPIETARARFLDIIVDHFIGERLIEVAESTGLDYGQGDDKLNKRKQREIHYEGDPRFALPLMYIANLYETIVGDVNMRLASLIAIREKTIGVALEAAGGLYRKLTQKFPKRGPCSFKRRELATSHATRTKFPELVVHEEKRVRFVVIDGLMIIEKPNNIDMEDANWFKRLTGRNEVAVSARDYKFYSPRHKNRRTPQPAFDIPGSTALTEGDNSPLVCSSGFHPSNETQNQQQPQSRRHIQPLPNQPHFHLLEQAHNETIQQNQHSPQFSHMHQCTHTSHLPDTPQQHQSHYLSQHMTCLQAMTTHLGGRLNILPASPAKFCDECGSPYLRETSKFCSECGTKRLGI